MAGDLDEETVPLGRMSARVRAAAGSKTRALAKCGFVRGHPTSGAMQQALPARVPKCKLAWV